MPSNDRRLDPDALLRAIEADRKSESKGKLRLFLGMSAGVGKTFAMLKAAHQKQNEGVDIVIGVVETHGRSETASLLAGLEIIPRQKIVYRKTEIEEMDIDAILKRKPKIVVVDELAHTNAPNSRHPKRYQDVLEILDAGIDVYTALNVQHFESRKDSIEAITGVTIRETVPDSILEQTHLVELVDIAPSELLKRLKEGKVYLGEKAEAATQNFFKEDKLTALREIALRVTAERVDQDLQRFASTRDELPWQTNERLLVAISHSPYSEKVIRATRRLAYNLEAPWIAVHVNTGISLNEEDQNQLIKNLNLAKELNAEVITTTDADLAEALKRICRQKNVTQVVVGRPTRSWFRNLIEGGALLDRLVDENLEVDVHVIRQDKSEIEKLTLVDEASLYQDPGGWVKYYYSFWYIIFITIVSSFLEPFIGYRAVGFIYLLAVIVAGISINIGAVIFTATLSAVVWNFVFIPPRFTFEINQPDDIILCISYFVVALITGFLTNRIRVHEKLIRDREEKTNVLNQVLQDISNSQNKSEFIRKVTDRVSEILKGSALVILKSRDNFLQFDKVDLKAFELSEKEQAVAVWSFTNQKSAGWSTETLSQARSLYLPLRGVSEIVGVFLFKPEKKIKKLALDQQSLLESITTQLGISIERHFLSRRLVESRRLKDSEMLQQTLLNSISHEMRTPLTAILGSVSALEKHTSRHKELAVIAESLSEAGERLNRVIENLLDMSRINSGVLGLKIEWHDLSDLIGVVLSKLNKVLDGRSVSVFIAEDIGLVEIDFRLFEHALSNILVNAIHYAGKDAQISIRVELKDNKVCISIMDSGVGIPEESVPQIFDKFYRVPGTPAGGTGLGLSIVKGIVDLHGGKIGYESNLPTGSKFVIELPYKVPPVAPKES